jgi:glycosyltransferase involved in cell wall biosynthesis
MIAQNELDQKAMGGTELMGAGLEKHVDPELLKHFQIIRSRVRKLEPGKIPILWLHDLAGDPETLHLQNEHSRARFARLVFVSDWQMQSYKDRLRIPYTSRNVVLKNAIQQFERGVLEEKPKDGPIRLIYHSTPHRGLNILTWAFEQLQEKYNIELDVFSSFKLYGWAQRDEQFETLFSRLRNNPKVRYHSSVPNDVVRAALAQAHIFAYPSIWEETSCICAIEAMSAGCRLVVPNYGALPETTAGFAAMYQWDENIEIHAQTFLKTLEKEIQDAIRYQSFTGMQSEQKQYADAMYGWDRRAVQWEELLESILNEQSHAVSGEARQAS